jgi:phage gp29-like protein
MKLFNNKFEMTDDAIRIQEEFEALIKPFYDKYGKDYNPIELEWVINSAIQLRNCATYMNRVTSFYETDQAQ